MISNISLNLPENRNETILYYEFNGSIINRITPPATTKKQEQHLKWTYMSYPHRLKIHKILRRYSNVCLKEIS